MKAKTTIWVFGLTLVVLLAAVASIVRDRPVESVSAAGHVTRLEGFEFTTNRVDYKLPRSIWDGKAFQNLPGAIRSYLPAFKPALWDIIRPSFPGEPVLSCAFSVREANDERPVNVLRVVTADENGNEFDPVAQHAGFTGQDPIYWVAQVDAFPRRGSEVILKLKQGAETLGEFRIPNPSKAAHPEWEPEKLPVRRSVGDLEVSLVDFRTGIQTNIPSTLCSFLVTERGQGSTNWVAKLGEVSDATGNHWRVFWDPRFSKAEGPTQRVGFLGALWEGESAWKLRVGFEKLGGFREDDLISFKEIAIPTGTNIVFPNLRYETPDARVEVLAIFGPEASEQSAGSINPNIWPARGSITVAISGQLLQHERSLGVIEVVDQDGSVIPVTPIRNPITPEAEQYMPYTLKLEVPPSARTFNISLAAPKIRMFEFLAKPDHFSE